MSAGSQFDPDAFMAQQQGFDPDKFMSGQQPGQAPPAAPAGPKQGFGSYASQVGQNIWNTLKGGAEFGRDVFLAGSGIDTVGATQRLYESAVKPQVEQFQEAGKAFRGEGEYASMPLQNRLSETFGHGLAGALPGVGPAAAQIGEKVGDKDYTGAAADATTLAATVAAPELARRLPSVPVKLPTMGAAMGADPGLLTWQALEPRGGIEEHYNTGEITRGDIQAAATRRQMPINNARQLKSAIDFAELDNRDAFQQHWSQVQGQIPLDHIGDLIDQTLDPETRRLAGLGDPEAIDHIRAVHDYANSFRGMRVTPDEFRQLQEHVNAENDVFEKKTDEKQAKMIAARGGDPMLRAKAVGYRDLVRQFVGDDAADIQYRYGRLKDWEAAAVKAMDKAGREKPPTTVQAAGKVLDIPGKTIHGNMEQIPADLGGGKTDSYIKWAFDRTAPGKPLPLPQGLTGSYGAVSNIFPGSSAPRLLPQGSAPFTQGTSAINPSANPPRGGPGSYRAGLLGPGSPTQGQGVTQVPPAGAANKFSEGPPLIQVPRGPNAAAPEEVSPRTAAAPEDTSFVRGVSVPASDPTFYRMPIAQQMAKQVWEAVKPKAEEAPAPAPETPPPAAVAPEPEPEAPAKVSPAVVAKAKRQAPPGSVDTRLEKALGTLREGMAKTRQAPPGTPPPQAAVPPAAAEAKQAASPATTPKVHPESLSDAQIAEAQKVSGIKDQLENVKYYQYGAGSRLATAAADRAAAISDLLESMDPVQAKRILEAGQ